MLRLQLSILPVLQSCGAGAQDAGLHGSVGWSENTVLGKTWSQLDLLIELPLVSVTVGFHLCVSVMHCREEGNCLVFGQR